LIALFSTPARAETDLLDVDLRRIVSRADLAYDAPVSRSEEGMPVGNGRMGSLVWTTPAALRFQINRVDVFAVDSRTRSFPQAHTDYASGCGFVDLHFAGHGGEPFAGKAFAQNLSVYDGLVTAKGDGVGTRVLAWHARDVMAVEVEDGRPEATGVDIDLRMLRYAMQYIGGTGNDWARRREAAIQTNAHTARMRLEVRDGRTVLVQEFREGEYYNASAVAVGVIGRESKATFYNESTVRLSAPPGAGTFTVLIGSASSFDPQQDVAALAVAHVEAAAGKGFDALLADNRAWWADFWSRAFVRLHSDDGEADFVEQNYTYFLYVMASSSRGGDYPARFGGMLWYSNGDMRTWGSKYWWANQSCYYNGLAPANRFELLEPTFSMYSRMYDACATAARQQWGSQGIWIPETTHFSGPDVLPDDIAAEMQDLYLLRKPWARRSERFQRYAETVQSLDSRWNWIAPRGRWENGRWVHEEKEAPPFGHVTHIFGTTAKVAYLYWQKYEYTLDRAWLRDRAYPMLKGTVEFYRNFPNLKKEADGKYHIHHTNSNEPAWGVQDSDEDLWALRGVLPPLIRASEILGADEDLRPAWREFLQNLAPLPTSDDPQAMKADDYAGPRVWVKGLLPAAKPGGMLPDGNTLPAWNFDLCTLECPDAEMMKVANATFDAFTRRSGIGPETRVGTLSRLPIAAAQLGRVAEALHAALLHSAPPAPGGEPVLRVFPAWPREWDATYTLLARGGFLVTASMEKGRIEFVQLKSQAGGECRLRNPWPETSVTVVRGGASEDVTGTLIRLTTAPGEVVTLHPKGAAPAKKKVS
jgi:hypothetical protein